jgi:hypothetical protein
LDFIEQEFSAFLASLELDEPFQELLYPVD